MSNGIDTKLSTIVKFSALLPILGSFAAVTHEWLFFSALGLNLVNYYELTDILKISILYILPMVVILGITNTILPLIMYGFLIKTPQNQNDLPKYQRLNRFYKFIAFTVAAILTSYHVGLFLLFGYRFGLFVFVIFATMSCFLFLKLLKSHYHPKKFLDAVKYLLFYAIPLGYLAIVTIALGSAENLLLGRTKNLIKVEFDINQNTKIGESHLIRSLTKGDLIISGEGLIYFLPTDRKSHYVKTKPQLWRGIMCSMFNKCEIRTKIENNHETEN